MNFQSQKMRYAAALIVGAVLGLMYFASVVTANADSTTQVSVAGNGQTMIKGARVVQVSGNELVVVTEWGSAVMQWRVRTTGSTRFIPQMPSRDMAQSIKVGHIIGFSGTMDMAQGIPTVYASVVKDEQLMQSSVVLSGSVIGTTDRSLIIQTESGTSTIAVSTGTILTMDGNKASLADIGVGDYVKAFGTFNTIRDELLAERATVALADLPLRSEPQKQGFMSSILAWLRGSDRLLSVR